MSETNVYSSGYFTIGSKLYRRDNKEKNTYISNFFFELKEVINTDSGCKYKVEIFVDIDDDVCNIHTGYCSFDEFKKIDFFKLDRHLVVSTERRSLKYLYYLFQQQASVLEDSDIYLVDKLGDNIINGKHYYCMGDHILPPCNDNILIDEKLKRKFKLQVDETLTPQEAYHGMMRFYNVELGKTDIMMVYSIIGCMRTVLKYSGAAPNFSLFLTGETQTKKTTGLTFSNSIYNRLETMRFNTIRVDSSLPYAETMIEEYRDTCVNYDDLFKNSKDSSGIDCHVQGVIREIADNSPRFTVKGGRKVNAQPAITGEYCINNLSDLGRVWMIHFNKSLNEKRLQECQDRPLDIPTFMRDFISWIYRNFNKVTQSINDDRQIFMKKIVNNKGRYRRLNIAEFIFQVVFNKVLEYGIEIKAVSNKECCELMKGFAKRLCECKERQQMVMERLEKEEALNNISYAKAFVDCIDNNIIKFDDNISSDKQCFVHTVKNIKCIYIRSEYLADVLNYQYDQKNTVKFYTNYFAKKNLLYRNKDSNVVKYEGKCYMAIRIDRLKIEVYSDDYKIDKLFI